MIARHQTILFGVLLAASIAMGGVLWQLRERAHQRLLQGEDSAPTQAPQVAPAEQATLLVANDADNSLLSQVQTLPLPQDQGARARLILGKLMDLYAAPNAAHPVSGGASSIAQVFLLPAPESKAAPNTPSAEQLAVVDLAGGFVDGHPSGIFTEALTIESICGTLRANLPQVAEVRFLVDGQPRGTLAGHADLTRTYLTSDMTRPAGGGNSN